MSTTKSLNAALALQLILMSKVVLEYSPTKEHSFKILKKDKNIRLVIVEYDAPEMDIIKFFERIERYYKNIPVILVLPKKGLINSLVKEFSKRPCVKDIIEKPVIDEETLKNKIYKALGFSYAH